MSAFPPIDAAVGQRGARPRARLHVRRLHPVAAAQRARAPRPVDDRSVVAGCRAGSRSSGRSCRRTWTRSPARRWRSCRPKRAASASSTAGSGPEKSSRRSAKSRSSSAPSTASSRDPWSIAPGASLDEAAALMARTRVGTLVVVDDARRLAGPADRARHALRRRAQGSRVSDRMTPRRATGRPPGADRTRRRRAGHGRAQDQEAAAGRRGRACSSG